MRNRTRAFLWFLLCAVLFTGAYAFMGLVFALALPVGVASSALLVYGGWFVLVVIDQ